MNVSEFQEKLSSICELAKENGNTLTQAQIREHFAGMELETGQLLKVLQYLKVQGISIEGMESAKAEEEQQEEQKVSKGTKVPLTGEEEAYFKEYMAEIEIGAESGQAAEELFAAAGQGDSLAGAQLTKRYLPVAAQMAADMNCEEIHLADLIQEANVGLLLAVEEAQTAVKNDIWLRMEIRKSIIQAIEEQTQTKFQDECLVSKVEKLETAINDLTDEDGENEFSVDEIAVILDMKVEEIRDILRLTGDDK